MGIFDGLLERVGKYDWTLQPVNSFLHNLKIGFNIVLNRY